MDDSKLEFKILSLKSSRDYHIFNAVEVEKKLPNGKKGVYTQVEAPNWVSAIVYDESKGLYAMVRLFRHGIGKVVTEFTSGTVEGDETDIQAIIRECKEEIGLDPNDILGIEYLYRCPTNPGFMNNKMTCFFIDASHVNENDYKGRDSDEFIDIKFLSFEEINNLINNSDDVSIMMMAGWDVYKELFHDNNKNA